MLCETSGITFSMAGISYQNSWCGCVFSAQKAGEMLLWLEFQLELSGHPEIFSMYCHVYNRLVS